MHLGCECDIETVMTSMDSATLRTLGKCSPLVLSIKDHECGIGGMFEDNASNATVIHPIWVYKKHLKCSTSHVSKIFRKNSTGVPFLVLYFALYLDHPNEFSASLIQEVIKEDMRA